MIALCRLLNKLDFASLGLIWLMLFAGRISVSAQVIVLHLKGGDQISGLIVTESTNQVVISNAWTKALAVPLSEIASRETLKSPVASVVAAPASAAGPEVAPAKPAPPANLAAAPKAAGSSAAKPKGDWHGQFNVGLDALFSTKNQQDYFGKLKLIYTQPYEASPKKFFRNTSTVSGQYQRTDGQVSANRASGNNKTDFDLGLTSYGYCSAGGGFDAVRKIDYQYQVGPGLGKHLIRGENSALNVESGIDYEAQYRRNNNNSESVFLRLAEDWTWKIRSNLTLTEKFEFLPNLESVELGQYRMAFASTLSYGFWKNLSLNLSADDSYDTDVAPGVQRNELDVRLTLGATF